MNRVLLSCLLLSSVARAEGDPKTLPSLSVLPFASLGDVPPRAGQKAAGMLSTEFKSAEAVRLIEPKKGKETDLFAEPLAGARKLVTEAQDLRKKKKFRLAEEALLKALAAYKAVPAGLTDIGEVVDAWALLSAVQYVTGKDDEGRKSLLAALSLAPDRELPLAQTSPAFSKVVFDTRKAIASGPKGTLQLETTPSGAAFIDGVPLGGTPMLVKDVPPGLHYWRVALPSGEQLGGTVEVAAGKLAKASGTAVSKDPLARVLTSLSLNKVDAELVAAAKEHAGKDGSEWVVFGALSSNGKGLSLDSFLYAAKENEVRRLERTNFDTELLSAGVEFYKIAGAVAAKGAKVGDVVKVPSAVTDKISAAGSKPADVRYGQNARKEASLDTPADAPEPTKDEPRKPLEQSRKPLIKK